MSEKKPDRSRFVYRHWVRDPKGKLLEKPPPKGARPANDIIWGHSLNDFYWISRIPGINILTIWSRSMIKEYGENFLDEEHDEEPEPRRLRPWPSLTLPDHLAAGTACMADASIVPEAPAPTASNGPAAASLDADAPKIGDSAEQEEKPSEGMSYMYTAPISGRCSRLSATACAAEPAPEAPVAAAHDAAADTMVVDPPKIDGDVKEMPKPKTRAQLALLSKSRWGAATGKDADGAEVKDSQESCMFCTALIMPWILICFLVAVRATNAGPAAPPVFHNLPMLEEFIPEEYFPDILYVNDPDRATMNEYYYSQRNASRPQSREPVPRKYKRVWPRFARDTEPATAFNTDTNLRIAHLNLSGAPLLGVGNHSVVHRAALRLPRPLSARSPTGEVTVAAKAGFSGGEARQLLLNEGKFYDAFPKHLQEGWCGMNLVAPILHPVPVGAVVPKFYGYYVPEDETDAVKSDEMEGLRRFKCGPIYKSWYQMSPLLLLEECGSPIVSSRFTADERSECYSLALRLHYAEFTQNSFYVRNILRQPGPLTVAPSARSDSTPSFRIIDFGRGEHWQRIEAEEAAVQTDKKHLEQARKSYWELRDYEVRKAHSELQIRDFDY
ncbi:hypothetical protein C8R47DRAFT_987866 [Mycena vitilis]|nr:hypothetical protein C8R47DRAFT_987866 [Mycena vitilis]